mgnify:CR=1 FL=1
MLMPAAVSTLIQYCAIGGRTALYRVSPRNGRMTEIIGGRRRLNGFSYDQRFTKVAYVSTSVDRPTELFIADANGRNERQLTSFNEELNREIGRRRIHLGRCVGRTIAAALDHAHVWHPFTQHSVWPADEPIVVDRAEGMHFWDTDGKRYLDGVSSL